MKWLCHRSHCPHMKAWIRFQKLASPWPWIPAPHSPCEPHRFAEPSVYSPACELTGSQPWTNLMKGALEKWQERWLLAPTESLFSLSPPATRTAAHKSPGVPAPFRPQMLSTDGSPGSPSVEGSTHREVSRVLLLKQMGFPLGSQSYRLAGDVPGKHLLGWFWTVRHEPPRPLALCPCGLTGHPCRGSGKGVFTFSPCWVWEEWERLGPSACVQGRRTRLQGGAWTLKGWLESSHCPHLGWATFPP